MIFFAQTAANQSDLVVKEALRAGAENVRATASGVQFSASLETGYRFTMTTRIASRVLLALYFDASMLGEHLPDFDGAQYFDIEKLRQEVEDDG